jgi:hypothetical protein
MQKPTLSDACKQAIESSNFGSAHWQIPSGFLHANEKNLLVTITQSVTSDAQAEAIAKHWYKAISRFFEGEFEIEVPVLGGTFFKYKNEI